VYGAAITTPERNETFALAAASGDATNNRFAYWANAGATGKFAPQHSSWLVGAGIGFLPDQGGFGANNLGRGHDLAIYSLHADVTAGRFGFLGEYLAAEVERGRADNRNATPHGFFVQPTFLLTPTLEAVVRYQWLDSDGRGLNLGDVIRSAASGGTMNIFTEWYAGANWYVRGPDLRFQLGGLYGETKDTVAGAPAKARTVGVRSQVQVQF
jgi:hypothetical protein